MPLGYLSCLAWFLQGYTCHICQMYYSIYSKLRIFPYTEVINRSTRFKVTKRQQRLKNNDQISFFCFLCCNVPANKCHKKKWSVLFFTRIKIVARVLGVCTRDRTYQMEKTVQKEIKTAILKKVYGR